MHWHPPKDSSLYKNKRILRAVDQSIVEQGRWSVFGHLIIFAVVEWLMGFRAIPAVLSYSFALVFLSVALARLYFILNFTQQYGRGPVRWRNQYGFLTLLGAALWSGYLTLTIVHPGYTSSLTFVWIYTAAVVATHVFIFAAYRTMAQWYNGILLIPPGIAGVAMLQWEMVTLGLALLLYFAFMELTSRQVSARFWDTQRSRQNLELALGETSAAEHHAALQAEANQHSLVQLIQMIRQPLGLLTHQLQQPLLPSPVQGVDQSVQKPVNDLTALLDQFELYVRIKSHEFDDLEKVFSINRQIEQALLDVEPVASARGLDLSCAIDPLMPERLLGQAQVVKFLLHQSLLFSVSLAQGEEVIFKIQTDENTHHLIAKVRFSAAMNDDYWQQCQTLIRSDQTIESFPSYDPMMLSLAICVLLVRHQKGRLSLLNTDIKAFPVELSFQIPIEVSTQSERQFQANKVLQEKTIWIAGFPVYGTRTLEAELVSWGMQVTTLSLTEQPPADASYDFGLMNVSSESAISSHWLTAAEQLTEQGVAVLLSPAQADSVPLNQFSGLILRKPWLRRSLHRWLVRQLEDPDAAALSAAAQTRSAQANVLLMTQDQDLIADVSQHLQPNQLIVRSDSDVPSIMKQTRINAFDMILMDEALQTEWTHDVIAQLRQFEREQQLEPTPIILLTSGHPAANGIHRLHVAVDGLAKPVQASHLYDCIERYWG